MGRDYRSYDELSPPEQAEARRVYDDAPYIDPNAAPLPSFWENRLLGRTLFDLPDPDGRERWKTWRRKHPVAIDQSIKELVESNKKNLRIDIAHIQNTYGDTIGWCPYYMARWHLVLAATLANHEVGWCEQGTADGARRATILEVIAGKKVEVSRSHKTEAVGRVRKSNDALEKIAQSIAEANLFHVDEYDKDAEPKFQLAARDPKGLTAFSPKTQGEVCVLDHAIRKKAQELYALIGTRTDLASKTDGTFPIGEDNVWRNVFAGYFGVAWNRMTDRPCTEKGPFIDWMTQAWNSLWDEPPEVAWTAAALNARNAAERYKRHWLLQPTSLRAPQSK